MGEPLLVGRTTALSRFSIRRLRNPTIFVMATTNCMFTSMYGNNVSRGMRMIVVSAAASQYHHDYPTLQRQFAEDFADLDERQRRYFAISSEVAELH